MRHDDETIDKLSFRVNIPIVVSVIIATALFMGAYFQIQAEITQANTGIAAILEKVSATSASVTDLTKKFDDLNSRVIRLEARVK